MIHVIGKEKSNSEMLFKAYIRKMDRLSLLKNLKSKRQFRKPSEKRKKTRLAAIMRENYRRKNGLI